MRHSVLLAALLAAASLGAQAQDYPSRPIRMVIGYAPGGPVDVASRILAPGLEKQLGQPVMVDNRGGASGAIAAAQVAKAAPDGYTLFFAASATQTMVPHIQKNLGFDPLRDYTAISLVVSAPNVLVVGKDVPVKNVADLVAFAKANPKKVTYGSAGLGASNHLSGELLVKVTGAPMLHVPYKGNGPAMTDVIGGQITFMFDAVATARTATAGGRAIALAVTSAKRHPAIPDVPTMAEAGLPNFEVASFYGLQGPPGMAPALVQRLNAATRAALAEAEMNRRFVEAGYEVTPSTPEAYARAVNVDYERWRDVTQGMKFEQ